MVIDLDATGSIISASVGRGARQAVYYGIGKVYVRAVCFTAYIR